MGGASGSLEGLGGLGWYLAEVGANDKALAALPVSRVNGRPGPWRWAGLAGAGSGAGLELIMGGRLRAWGLVVKKVRGLGACDSSQKGLDCARAGALYCTRDTVNGNNRNLPRA
jgi:hypothetical protein